MRNLQFILLITVCASLLFIACEKDNISNTYFDANPHRQEKIAAEAKSVLASADLGWVMMVKSNLSEDVYTPIVLKFDTTENSVAIKTVYGLTEDTKSYFSIKTGNGAPQLIFTSGSIISTLFRIGIQASDLTDHIFNILDVSEESVTIQCYRSGRVYSKEGGVIYKLFKRPASWNWAEEDLLFDWTIPEFTVNINNVIGEMKLEYLQSNTMATFKWRFWSWSNPAIFRIRDPFSTAYNASAGGFKPMNYFIVTGEVTDNVTTTVTMGHNALSIYPIPYYAGTNEAVIALAKKIKTHYLLVKSITRVGNNVKMAFEAYGKDGEVILKASYDNLR